MKFAVASGKGGTGKTTVSLAIAEVLGSDTLLIDCDVEEPNCHLFSVAKVNSTENIQVLIPEFIENLCNGCGACIKSCRFNALARLGKRVLVFPELCHGCAGCILSCPTNALVEGSYEVGKIEFRSDSRFKLISGVMNVGYSMAPPVIRRVKEYGKDAEKVVFDSPPGTACSFVTTVKSCDYVFLVTEPTPFGLHDLKLAVATLKDVNPNYGVILNRATGEFDSSIEEYCKQENIQLLMKIPFSHKVAKEYSQGRSLLEAMPSLKADFEKILEQIRGVQP